MAVYRYAFLNPTNVGTGAWWTIPGSVSTGQANLYSAAATRYLHGGPSYALGDSPPAGAQILGLELRLNRWFIGTGAIDGLVRLYKGSTALVNRTEGATLPNSSAVARFGGPADLHGTTWTTDDLTQIQFDYQAVYTPGTPGTAYVDGVEVWVYCANAPIEREETTMIRYLNDVVTSYLQVTRPSTGEAIDASGSPTYRVYEESTNTPILTGTMALLDDSGTVGLYSSQFTANASAGFEVGKTYCVRTATSVDGVSVAQIVDRFTIRNAIATDVWNAPRVPASGANPTTCGAMLDLILKFFTQRYRKEGDAVTLYTDANSPLLTQDYSVTSTGFDRGKAQ